MPISTFKDYVNQISWQKYGSFDSIPEFFCKSTHHLIQFLSHKRLFFNFIHITEPFGKAVAGIAWVHNCCTRGSRKLISAMATGPAGCAVEGPWREQVPGWTWTQNCELGTSLTTKAHALCGNKALLKISTLNTASCFRIFLSWKIVHVLSLLVSDPGSGCMLYTCLILSWFSFYVLEQN